MLQTRPAPRHRLKVPTVATWSAMVCLILLHSIVPTDAASENTTHPASIIPSHETNHFRPARSLGPFTVTQVQSSTPTAKLTTSLNYDDSMIMHDPIVHSKTSSPTSTPPSNPPEITPCPEYCVCSRVESDTTVSCHGERDIFPFPTGQLPRGQVSRLRLENFQKSDLRFADVAGLVSPDTRELRLPRNGISTIKDGTFNGHKNNLALKRLDLSGNKLSRLTNQTFIGLGRGAGGGLMYLDLSSNRIGTIDAAAFVLLGDLIQLELNGNRLAGISGEIFAGLTALQYLNLEGNAIEVISPVALGHLSKLVHLNLAMNPKLGAGDAFGRVDFSHLHGLQYCDLRWEEAAVIYSTNLSFKFNWLNNFYVTYAITVNTPLMQYIWGKKEGLRYKTLIYNLNVITQLASICPFVVYVITVITL